MKVVGEVIDLHPRPVSLVALDLRRAELLNSLFSPPKLPAVGGVGARELSGRRIIGDGLSREGIDRRIGQTEGQRTRLAALELQRHGGPREDASDLRGGSLQTQ